MHSPVIGLSILPRRVLSQVQFVAQIVNLSLLCLVLLGLWSLWGENNKERTNQNPGLCRCHRNNAAITTANTKLPAAAPAATIESVVSQFKHYQEQSKRPCIATVFRQHLQEDCHQFVSKLKIAHQNAQHFVQSQQATTLNSMDCPGRLNSLPLWLSSTLSASFKLGAKAAWFISQLRPHTHTYKNHPNQPNTLQYTGEVRGHLVCAHAATATSLSLSLRHCPLLQEHWALRIEHQTTTNNKQQTTNKRKPEQEPDLKSTTERHIRPEPRDRAW